MAFLLSSTVFAQVEPERVLIPIGGEYLDTYPGFFSTLVERSNGGLINVLVLPIATSPDPFSISNADRAKLQKYAEARQQEMLTVCASIAQQETRCKITVAPIYVRPEAQSLAVGSLFARDLSGIFILGGDAEIAKQVIEGTVLEKELDQAYQSGVVVAGTSGSAAPFSSNLLVGLKDFFVPVESFQFGAINLWQPPERDGYTFGIPQAIIDQRFFELGRMPRLLNAISLPDAPHVGIGIDSRTGIKIASEERLTEVIGIYSVAILDAETYHAATGIQYSKTDNLISLRNVLFHLLPPGSDEYNLTTQQNNRVFPPDILERQFDALQLPPNAGTIILTGGIDHNLQSNPILTQFTNLAGGQNARILILATGFSGIREAQEAAVRIKTALGIHAKVQVIPNNSADPVTLPGDITGIIVTASDQSLIQSQLLAPVKQAWLAGMPVLFDNAAAAVVGDYYAAESPIQSSLASVEAGTQKSLLQGNVNILPGLALLDVKVEPQLIENNRWGRLIALAYKHPESISLGLPQDSALVLDRNGALASGANATIILDTRYAWLGLGTNRGYYIVNALIDVFTPGERVYPILRQARFSSSTGCHSHHCSSNTHRPGGRGSPCADLR